MNLVTKAFFDSVGVQLPLPSSFIVLILKTDVNIEKNGPGERVNLL